MSSMLMILILKLRRRQRWWWLSVIDGGRFNPCTLATMLFIEYWNHMTQSCDGETSCNSRSHHPSRLSLFAFGHSLSFSMFQCSLLQLWYLVIIFAHPPTPLPVLSEQEHWQSRPLGLATGFPIGPSLSYFLPSLSPSPLFLFLFIL